MKRIREATNLDREEVREVHLRAFPEEERQMVAALAINLLSEETSPETIALVAEIDGKVAGHVAFSPVTIENNESWNGYILAPLGVKPEYQKRRIGSELIENGIDRLTRAGINILFVYGDPKYYCRYGFTADSASNFLPPYELQYPFGWQALVLNEGGSSNTAFSVSCVASLCDPRLW